MKISDSFCICLFVLALAFGFYACDMGQMGMGSYDAGSASTSKTGSASESKTGASESKTGSSSESKTGSESKSESKAG